VNPGEQFLAIPALTTARREAGAAVSEQDVAAMLTAGAPHVIRRHRALAQATAILAWLHDHPGFAPPPPDSRPQQYLLAVR
jgi:hypothetical protein